MFEMRIGVRLILVPVFVLWQEEATDSGMNERLKKG
jgi:hypothetical protein